MELGPQLRRQLQEAAVAGADRHVLAAVDRVGDREAGDRRAEVDLPEDLPRRVVEGPEAAVHVAPEHEPAAGGGQGHGGGPLLVVPGHPAGLGRDGLHAAHVVVARGDLRAPGDGVEPPRLVLLVGRRHGHHPRAHVAQRHVHRVGQRTVGARLPVLPAAGVRAGQHRLPRRGEDELRVLGHRAGGPVDAADHVLDDGRRGPQELAGLPVEGVDDARLAGNAGHHPAHLARVQPRVDPAHRGRVRPHRGIDQQALERVVEVPVVVHVLVVPDDLAGVAVQRQRRVVVEVRQVGAAEHVLGRRRGDRRADVDHVQLGVVARHHPRADVRALLERHVAPGLVARLAGGRNEPRPPQLLAGRRVVRGDDAAVRPAARVAAPARVHLAAGDDRPRGLVGRVHPVVEDLGVPDHLAGLRVQREDVVVHAGVDDELVVDGDVAVGVDERADHVVGQVVRAVPPVLPDEIAGHRVQRLDDVARIGHEQHAVADQRRPLLAARRQRPRPHQPQVADVVSIDLVQRAVPPAVQRPPPHQPLVGARVRQLRVGDRADAIGFLRDGRRGNGDNQDGQEAARYEPQSEPGR